MSEIPDGALRASPSPMDQEPLDPPADSPVVLAHIIAEAIRDLTENTHIHTWDILGVQNPPKRPIHPRNTVWPTTIILIRCRECNLPQTEELDGTWTEEQVKAKINE